eukprot:3844439-Amphidinium_carterae.1
MHRGRREGPPDSSEVIACAGPGSARVWLGNLPTAPEGGRGGEVAGADEPMQGRVRQIAAPGVTRCKPYLAFCQAWISTTRTGLLPGEWCSLHEDVLYVLFPLEETKALLELEDDTEEILKQKTNVKAVVNASACGSRLFAGTVKRILGIEVEKVIEKHLAKLNEDDISEDSILIGQRACAEELKQIDCIDMLASKREVVIDYRGIGFKCQIGSLGEQAELAIRSWVRGAATISDVLQELPAESGLVDDSEIHIPIGSIDEKVVLAAKQARRTFNHHVATLSEVNGESIRVTRLISSRPPSHLIRFPDMPYR